MADHGGHDGRRVRTRIVHDLGSAGPELEIEYDGLEPPASLFAALESLGWVAPVPMPPPASAIDWSTPDRRAGTSYSVRPYRATGRARPGTKGATLEVVQGLLEQALAAADEERARRPGG